VRDDGQNRRIGTALLTSIEAVTGIEMKSSAGDPVWLPVEGFLDKPVAPEALRAEAEKLLQEPKTGATLQ